MIDCCRTSATADSVAQGNLDGSHLLDVLAGPQVSSFRNTDQILACRDM